MIYLYSILFCLLYDGVGVQLDVTNTEECFVVCTDYFSVKKLCLSIETRDKDQMYASAERTGSQAEDCGTCE